MTPYEQKLAQRIHRQRKRLAQLEFMFGEKPQRRPIYVNSWLRRGKRVRQLEDYIKRQGLPVPAWEE